GIDGMAADIDGIGGIGELGGVIAGGVEAVLTDQRPGPVGGHADTGQRLGTGHKPEGVKLTAARVEAQGRSGVVDIAAEITCDGKVARATGRLLASKAKVATVCKAPEMGSKRRIPAEVTTNARPSARNVRPSGVSPVENVCRVLSLRLIRVSMFALRWSPKCATSRYLESGDRERAPGCGATFIEVWME